MGLILERNLPVKLVWSEAQGRQTTLASLHLNKIYNLIMLDMFNRLCTTIVGVLIRRFLRKQTQNYTL